jgi:hypothetical protein
VSAITQVQAPVASAFSSQNSPIVTLGSTPPANSIILLAAFANENSGVVDVTTPPSGYTLVTLDETVNSVKVWLYYRVATAGESTSIQLFFNRNACCSLIAANYQGGDTSNWIDVFTSTRGNSTNPNSGSIATHNVGSERWISFLGTMYLEVFGTPTNSFTTLVNNNKNPSSAQEGITYGMFTRDLAAPTLGPATMSAPISNSRDWAGIIIALQERVAVTTVKTGGLVVGSTVASGAKSRTIAKTGGTVSDTKVSGARSSIYNRSGLLVTTGVLGGIRPAFYARAGKLKMDASIFTGTKLLLHGATIVRDTSDYIDGVASAKISTTGTGPQQGAYTTFVPLTTNRHTVSLYLKSFDPVRIRIATASGVNLESGPTINPTINWTRIVYTTTMQLLAGTTYRLYIETTQAVAAIFWIDGVQVEEGLVASPFTVGAKLSGGGPVGAVLREQKPAGLVMTYVVAPGSPTTYPTYQELYDHHMEYEHVMDTEQDYQQVFLAP